MKVEETKKLIEKFDNRYIHNFTIGTLSTYFHLLESKTSVDWYDNGTLVLGNLPGTYKQKAFVYENGNIDRLRELQKSMVVYSISKLDLPRENKFIEIGYNLKEVVNSDSYKDKRKRYKRLSYPFTWLIKNDIEIKEISSNSILEVKRLHDKWRDYKLSLPSTFKMMFPGSRYFRCASIGLKDKDYRVYGVFKNDDLIGVRVLYTNFPSLFDLAFFGKTWDPEYKTQLMESISIYLMHKWYDIGFSFLNCGSGVNKALHNFKSHWPHQKIISYSYSRL